MATAPQELGDTGSGGRAFAIPPAKQEVDALARSEPLWGEAPSSPADVMARVGRVMTWTDEWRSLVTKIRDAASAEPVDGATLQRAYDEAHDCLAQWCPAAAGSALMSPDQGESATRLLGPHIESLAEALYAADRQWPHDRRGWHEGLEAWPPEPRGVVDVVDDLIYDLERACQQGAFLILASRVLQARVGERIDVVAALREWNLPEEYAPAIVQWMATDPPRFEAKSVPFVVDQGTKSIYRSAKTTWEKIYTTTSWLWGSLLGLGLLVTTFALLNAAGLTSWPKDWFVKLMVLYLFVVGGAIIHIASMQLAAIRFDDRLEIYAAASGFAWLRLRWLSILRLLIPVVIVAGSLWGAGNIPHDFQDLSVALLSGYSADSLFRAGIAKVQAQAEASDQASAASTS